MYPPRILPAQHGPTGAHRRGVRPGRAARAGLGRGGLRPAERGEPVHGAPTDRGKCAGVLPCRLQHGGVGPSAGRHGGGERRGRAERPTEARGSRHRQLARMPRDIPLGNGKLLVTFDRYYQIRDIYFPHVGKENQTVGHPSRFGVWVDGQLSWLGPDWQISLKYQEGTMVSQVEAYHPGLQIRLVCSDAVDFYESVYVRKILVRT